VLILRREPVHDLSLLLAKGQAPMREPPLFLALGFLAGAFTVFFFMAWWFSVSYPCVIGR